jgi:hypothetical protein
VKILKNKKGFAMETAIWFMLLISALCFLMTSVAIYGHYQTEFEATELEREITLDQIGGYYLSSIKAGIPCSDQYKFQQHSSIPNGGYCKVGGGQYCYSLTGSVLTVWRDKGDRTTVLYVDASLNGNELVVSAWRYSEP